MQVDSEHLSSWAFPSPSSLVCLSLQLHLQSGMAEQKGQGNRVIRRNALQPATGVLIKGLGGTG